MDELTTVHGRLIMLDPKVAPAAVWLRTEGCSLGCTRGWLHSRGCFASCEWRLRDHMPTWQRFRRPALLPCSSAPPTHPPTHIHTHTAPTPALANVLAG